MYRTSKRTIPIVLCVLLIVTCCFAGCRSTDKEIASDSSSEAESSLAPPESTTPPDSSEVSSESSATTSVSSSPQTSIEDEIAEINPTENPVVEAPQTDGPPDISVSSPNQEYESDKIILSLDDTKEITISDADAKATILSYVDGMQESSYNAENTPPAMGGHNVTVSIHRNNVIEQYIFTEVTADGHSLGKDLQGDTFMWMITDSNALPYLMSLFA